MKVLPTGIFVYHVHAWCPQKAQRASDPPENAVTRGCETPLWDAGSCIQVLWKSKQYSEPLSHLSNPLCPVVAIALQTRTTGNRLLRLEGLS